MALHLPGAVDTIIIGNGPSALILSYILHGHVPRYVGTHPDPLLHAKLSARPDLLHFSSDLCQHFSSSLRYSTQSLPINTLLDTLIRPNADTEVGRPSCVEWSRSADTVSHVVLGDSPAAGGQWVENPVRANTDIGALSYAEMLSLPGYSYAEHYAKVHGQALPPFLRPSRGDVADYYATYPTAAGIADAVSTSTRVEQVVRHESGFLVLPQNIYCNHLVLASGVFTIPIPPPQILMPLEATKVPTDPLLVVGSGFSAADVIISAPSWRKIVHVYHWEPEDHPSPLRGCHQQAYPEYAGIYRLMKMAARSSFGVNKTTSPSLKKKRPDPFSRQRDWDAVYHGLPNAEVISCEVNKGSPATVQIRLQSGAVISHAVGGLAYVVGRRGSLDYLEPGLRAEVLTTGTAEALNGTNSNVNDTSTLVSGRTLRGKAEIDLEVAPSVFIVGSLVGDSLVRHAFGGCLWAASKIIASKTAYKHDGVDRPTAEIAAGSEQVVSRPRTPDSSAFPCAERCKTGSGEASPSPRSNGSSHQDLHLDRRRMLKAVNGS